MRLNPLDRLTNLCDPGTLEIIRSTVRPREDNDASAPGDGVVAGFGQIDGRPIACFAQDVRVVGGSLGVAHAESITRILSLAEQLRLPVISFVESSGARMQEGVAALSAYSRIFRCNVSLSRIAPQISVISGVAAGGACYSPALTDFIIMTRNAAMFLTGPAVVRDVTGQELDISELGGDHVHSRNGVCDVVTADDLSASTQVRRLLSYLPQFAGAGPPRALPVEPEESDPSAELPSTPRKVYDIRVVLRRIMDADSLLEVGSRWARSILTGFARLDGWPVGVIANQPRHLGGVLTSDSSQKAARFADTCDRLRLPMVVLVDTPGFMPGLSQEEAGIIRYGADLVRAFARATVPRITVVLRKAYGGAFIAMNSKDLGADMVFAWDGAELGVMGAETATRILRRQSLARASDPKAEHAALAKTYADEHLSTEVAAAGGFIDEVIAPQDTRPRLVGTLRAMENRVR